MSLALGQNEQVAIEAKLHWSIFIVPCIWGLIFTPSILMSFSHTEGQVSRASIFFLLGFGPLILRWLKSKTNKYIVTNKRVYKEEGILAKIKIDIPLNKINDVVVLQKFSQRIFGAGTLAIYTGNDKATFIRDIEDPGKFKSTLSEAMEKKVS